MSDGGKGSNPRPFSVDGNTFDSNWNAIEGFGDSWLERKKKSEAEKQAAAFLKDEYYDLEDTDEFRVSEGAALQENPPKASEGGETS